MRRRGANALDSCSAGGVDADLALVWQPATSNPVPQNAAARSDCSLRAEAFSLASRCSVGNRRVDHAWVCRVVDTERLDPARERALRVLVAVHGHRRAESVRSAHLPVEGVVVQDTARRAVAVDRACARASALVALEVRAPFQDGAIAIARASTTRNAHLLRIADLIGTAVDVTCAFLVALVIPGVAGALANGAHVARAVDDRLRFAALVIRAALGHVGTDARERVGVAGQGRERACTRIRRTSRRNVGTGSDDAGLTVDTEVVRAAPRVVATLAVGGL